jgi:hypothetical protein
MFVAINMNTYNIISALATMKIVPVHNQNFSKFSPWSLPSMLTISVLSVIPGAFFVYGEIRSAMELMPLPEHGRTPLLAFAYFMAATNMLLVLLAGPQLLGHLLKSCDSLIDIKSLPSPKMQWLIWLSAPVPFLAYLPSGVLYTDELREIPGISWEVVNLYSSVPFLILSFIFGLMQACILFIMDSILAYLLYNFNELKTANYDVEQLIDICDIYDSICKALAPLYLLLFATYSTSVMMMAFILYCYAAEDVSTIVFSVSMLLFGCLLLYHLASEASDCEDTVNQLLIYFRLYLPDSVTIWVLR